MSSQVCDGPLSEPLWLAHWLVDDIDWMRYPGAQPSPRVLMHMKYVLPQLGSQSSAL